ncbi:hypothetical protein ACWOFR_00505 [Carnobacterium gallinarum]|uniref:hypothetical protein n=1 Tax=Carnobacterium gallinarum TaxID=2749 RepID=UPI000557DEB8|nr:hypothetical protein [Carnobacterium gallinarum]
MTKYWLFLYKTTIRNKFNFIPIAILILLTIALLWLNATLTASNGFIPMIRMQNADNKNSFSDNKEVNLMIQEQIASNERVIELAEKNDWKAALTLQLKVLEETDIKLVENESQPVPIELKKSILGKKAIYQYLVKNNLKLDTLERETQGFPFVFRVIASLFPSVVILCIIALLTNLFTENFKQGINLDDLFPLKKQYLLTSKLGFGILAASTVYAIILLISFVSATIINGSNSLNYPALLNTPSFIDIRPIGSLIAEALFLQFLCIIFLVLFVYILAQLTKNKVATLFISVFIICGLVLTVTKVQPLAFIAHRIPFVYFNTIDILLQNSSYITNNPKVTWITGITTLLISILAELIIVILLNYKPRNKKIPLFER